MIICQWTLSQRNPVQSSNTGFPTVYSRHTVSTCVTRKKRRSWITLQLFSWCFHLFIQRQTIISSTGANCSSLVCIYSWTKCWVSVVASAWFPRWHTYLYHHHWCQYCQSCVQCPARVWHTEKHYLRWRPRAGRYSRLSPRIYDSYDAVASYLSSQSSKYFCYTTNIFCVFR